MKSAYELAMERLAAQEGASRPLSAEQKAALADVDARYRARTAEREIFLRQILAEVEATGQFDEADKVRRQLADEVARLAEEREAEKERIRRSS